MRVKTQEYRFLIYKLPPGPTVVYIGSSTHRPSTAALGREVDREVGVRT